MGYKSVFDCTPAFLSGPRAAFHTFSAAWELI